jgi:subtilisin family serine protease
VAVVDSGVDTSNKGLSDAIYSQGNDNKDFYYNDDTIYDSYLQDYHGTYIANTIACNDSESKIYGVAPEVSILPIKFLRNTSGSVSDAIRAINYACEKCAKIINCSWNFTEYSAELYNVIASHPDVLFICATGNSNLNLDKDNIYPASYNLKNILSVLAVDNTGKVYSSSGRGMQVDIAAPGVNIITKFPENDITYVSGTSVATALVSGVTALMFSVNERLTPKEIIDIVTKNVNRIDTLDGKCSSGGIIDAYNCIRIAKDFN